MLMYSYQCKFISLPGLEAIKLFSCSTQLNTKFELLINMKIPKVNEILRFKSSKSIIYPADKC